jgi:hypothetical protein
MKGRNSMTIATVDEQKELYNEAVREFEKYLSSLQSKERRNKIIAYVLKGISIFGGLAVVLNLQPTWITAIGFAIAGAAAVDTFLSVRGRLVVYATATLAINATLEGLKGKERVARFDANRLTDEGKAAEARQKLTDFYGSSINEINSKSAEIRTAVNDADIQALRDLAATPKQPEN